VYNEVLPLFSVASTSDTVTGWYEGKYEEVLAVTPVKVCVHIIVPGFSVVFGNYWKMVNRWLCRTQKTAMTVMLMTTPEAETA
jgi:hypothetical protein